VADNRGYIYGIQAGDEPIVKVGWALDPDKRVKDFQTGNHQRLVVLARRPGSRAEEEALHKPDSIIAPFRVRGEWYQLCPEVMDVYGGGRWWPGYTPMIRRRNSMSRCPYCGQHSLIHAHQDSNRSQIDPKIEMYCKNSDCEIRTLVVIPGNQGPIGKSSWDERQLPSIVLGAEVALLPDGMCSLDNGAMTKHEYIRGRRQVEGFSDGWEAQFSAERALRRAEILTWATHWWRNWVMPGVPKPASLLEQENA
jgi:hypothetical protein